MRSQWNLKTKQKKIVPFASQINGAGLIEIFLNQSQGLSWVMRCESKQVACACEWQGKYFTHLMVPRKSSLPNCRNINTKQWPPSCPLDHRKAVTSHCRGDYQVLGFVSAPFSIIFRFHEAREVLIICAEMHWIAPFSKTCPKQVLPWIIASERCKQCLPCAQIPTGVRCSVLDLSEDPVNQDFWNEHPIEGRRFARENSVFLLGNKDNS